MKKSNKKINFILVLIIIIILIIFLNKNFHILSNVSYKLNKENTSDISFSLEIEVPQTNKIILPGEEIVVNFKIIKFGSLGKIDAQLELIIEDPNGEIIEKSLETFAIENKVNLVKIVYIGENAPLGTYEVTSKIFYKNDEKAFATGIFNVYGSNSKISSTNIFIIFTVIFTIIILLFFVILLTQYLQENRIINNYS